MEIHDALSQIAQIRNQIDRAAVYRGFRSAPVAISGMLALLGGVIQRYAITSPSEQFTQYLVLWVMVAVLSIVAVTTEILARCWFQRSKTFQESTMLTLEQLTPSCLQARFDLVHLCVMKFQLIWMFAGTLADRVLARVVCGAATLPQAIRLVALFLPGVRVRNLDPGTWHLST